MFHLIFNIGNHLALLRHTHRECAEAILPSKFIQQPAGLIDMFTGITFQSPHEVRNCEFRWNSNQQMSMVIESAHTNNKAIEILRDPSHVLEHVLTKAFSQPSLAVLCAENNVIKQLLMCTQKKSSAALFCSHVNEDRFPEFDCCI